MLGLSGSLAGLAIFIALCIDAATDPIVGSVSDNFRSRFGRRHPFLYVAAIPMAFAFYFLFAPPDGLSTIALFAWMTVFTVLVRGTMTLYYVPHLALGAELSEHYTERTSIVAYRWVFSIVGNLAAVVSAFAIFLVDTDGQPGDLVADNYPPFAVALAIAMAISIFVSAGGTHSQIPNLPATRFVERPGLGTVLVGVFRDTLEALRNASFRWLAGAALSSQVMVGLQAALQLYMANFFWELDDQSKMLLLMATRVGFFAGIALTRPIHERFDKRRTMLVGASLYMMADVADEHELETGRRQEGIFFGALSFASKGAAGLGTLIGGLALDVIQFPIGAAPDGVDAGTVFHLGAVYGPMLGVFVVFTVYSLMHYRLTEGRHAQIKAALAARS